MVLNTPFRWMFSAGFGGFAIPRSAGCSAWGSVDLQSAASEYQHLQMRLKYTLFTFHSSLRRNGFITVIFDFSVSIQDKNHIVCINVAKIEYFHIFSKLYLEIIILTAFLSVFLKIL